MTSPEMFLLAYLLTYLLMILVSEEVATHGGVSEKKTPLHQACRSIQNRTDCNRLMVLAGRLASEQP